MRPIGRKMKLHKTIKRVVLITALGTMLGLVVNLIRPDGLALATAYKTPAQRMEESVAAISTDETAAHASTGKDEIAILGFEDFQKMVSSKIAMILDARPAIFYELSHVPQAINLPREDFENAYRRLEPQLKNEIRPLIVYPEFRS
jgi:hypothetical protein